jgi:hypothetical protein
MAFMLFKRKCSGTRVYYSNAHQGYKLAGKNLLYRLWTKRNKPIECGWSVSADDLLKEHHESFNVRDYALVIDFHPGANHRIGLVEIEAIHVFTYRNGEEALWSPIMLELRDVYYDEDFDEPLTLTRKQEILTRFELSSTRSKIIEFLYLQGSGWNWGRNGSTNAAFIRDDARKYFQRYFNSEGQTHSTQYR